MRHPNLFILGAPRCGTSAMFEFLGAHPEIYPSPVKEPYFFAPHRNTRSLEEYVSLFAGANDEKWLVDATPAYLFMPDAPRRIHDLFPDARAIVMVRDPVEQMRSVHALRVLLHRASAVDLADELASAGPGKAHWYWKCVSSGENLARVLSVFPRDRVHVVVHDDFRSDNAGEYRRALEFLGVDTSFMPRFRTVNPSSEPRSPGLQRVLWEDDGLVRTAARAVVPARVRKVVHGTASKLNRRADLHREMDQDLAVGLWRQLRPDVELLSELLDRDLVSLWER